MPNSFSFFLVSPHSTPPHFANPPPSAPHNGSEQQLVSHVKAAAAIVTLLILIVALIVSLHNYCKSDSSNRAQSNATAGNGAASGQITVHLAQL
uniref:Uncharacterized protein n=1 Tax=Fagus sylvatica TaxID=28930 RepID=A0A2N9EKJ0_FAGSY